MTNKYTGAKNVMPQMPLFGIGANQPFEHNYFFALSPDAEVRQQLSQVADDLRVSDSLNGSWIASERYHLTLHHLGQFPEARPDLVKRALAAANTVRMQGFNIKLDHFMSFESKTGKFPCVLTSKYELAELKNFWQLLKESLYAQRLGQYVANSFTPHTTLLYSRQPIVKTHAVVPIQWPVKDFVLIESLVGKSEHIELGRWPLSA
ncbi:MAG: RNA 2',3'-cyclic phosphodiesterase [Arenimonas sp.]